MALDHGHQGRPLELMGHLLASLADSVLLTANQIETGLRRIYAEMDDIVLDIPK